MCYITNCCIENSRTSRRIVTLLSFLTLLSAGGIIFFAIQLENAETIKHVEDYIEWIRENEVRQNLFNGLIVLSSLIACFSCFGLTVKWMRNRCCMIIFGTLLFPLVIVTVVVGLASIYISYTAGDEFAKECKNLVLER